MKKLFVFLFTILSFYSNAQKSFYQWFYSNLTNQNESNVGQLINCFNIPTPTGCNIISNNTFVPAINYTPATNLNHLVDPFESAPFNLIPNWAATHGTPHIAEWSGNTTTWTVLPPENIPGLPNGTNYATLGTWPSVDPTNEPSSHEGIVQKIPNLVAGRTYFFSFFARIERPFNLSYSLEEFNIRLLNCADARTISTYNSGTRFAMPNWNSVPNQRIYCQSMSNLTWMRFTFTFTANSSNYNAISISPFNQDGAPNLLVAKFAFPELIDVTNFSAGPQPNPTPPNCTVTIGPSTPNCAPINAVFTWTSPGGINFPANANQQLQVDASNPQNVGVWTLRMEGSNAIAPNGSCGALPGVVIGTVNVPACVPPTPWPKVYYVNGNTALLKGNGGNIFSNVTPSGQLNQNINHIGDIPSSTNLNSHYSLHYTNNGVTNFYKENKFPLFTTSSGILQLGKYQGNSYLVDSYVDENTGNIVPNPSVVPFNERILCETNNGGYITFNESTNTMSYRSLISNFSVNVSSGIRVFKFNKNTNRVFVENGLSSLKVYDINANSFSLVASSPNNMGFWIIQIDNQDKIFVYEPNGVNLYNIYTNSFTPYSIPGLPSNTSFLMWSTSPYTSNEFLTNYEDVNNINSKIYYVNTTTTPEIVKSINKTGSFFVETYRYEIDGDNVYISNNFNSQLTLGTQVINQLPDIEIGQAFITKLNLLTDFSSFQSLTTNNKKGQASFKTLITPNPTTTNLTLRITENDKQSLAAYSLTVTDKMGGVLLRQANYTSGRGVDISRLEKGVYFATIINNKNEKVTVAFSKL